MDSILEENIGITSEVIQGSYEWKMARLGCATSSRFDSILCADKYDSVFKINNIGGKITPSQQAIVDYVNCVGTGYKKDIIEKCNLNSDSMINTLVKNEVLSEVKIKRGYYLTGTAEAYMNEILADCLAGQQTNSIKTIATDWGHENEPKARSEYLKHLENENPFAVVQETGFHKLSIDHPLAQFIGGSPDGLVDEDGILEIKCPFSEAVHVANIRRILNMSKDSEDEEGYTQKTHGIPKEYYAQVQGNLWVLCRQYCDFVSFNPRVNGPYRLVICRVDRDDEYIDRLANCVLKFVEILEVEKLKMGLV